MEKKAVKTVVLSLVLILLFAGCAAGNVVNDKDSGEIEVGEKEYMYYDGIYETYSSYYADDGYFRVMKLKVEDGKICEIVYDMIDGYGGRFSENGSDESESFKSEIKSLNSKAMQNQNSEEIGESSSFTEDYKLLLEHTLKNASENNNGASPLDMSFTYEDSFTDINDNTAHLSVEYSGGKAFSINYYITSPDGLKLEDYINEESFFSDTMSYASLIAYLEKVSEEGDTLKKEDLSDRTVTVIYDYNTLCDVIEEKHRRVDENSIDQLFSSL